MVLIFSVILIIGILAGQWLNLSYVHEAINFSTSVCLAYIMIEVGLEFSLEKRKLSSYGWDSLIALTAALLPAVLWFAYFFFVTKSQWDASLLSGLSSAPTSAGVLFAMLMAAGLSATWVFKKARVLAVLDDLATVLLLAPLQIMIHGFHWKAVAGVIIISALLIGAFRWQNSIKWPLSKKWIVVYSFILTIFVYLIKSTTHIHLEVLIPAFMWGCVIHPANFHEHPPKPGLSLDVAIKGLFMLLVGLSLPQINLQGIPWSQTAMHVIALTVLANAGKFFLVFCYSKEASLKERAALGVAMFPRGEVGAAVLLIGISYGLAGYANALAVMSLAVNLVLTGFFIWIVIRCLK